MQAAEAADTAAGSKRNMPIVDPGSSDDSFDYHIPSSPEKASASAAAKAKLATAASDIQRGSGATQKPDGSQDNHKQQVAAMSSPSPSLSSLRRKSAVKSAAPTATSSGRLMKTCSEIKKAPPPPLPAAAAPPTRKPFKTFGAKEAALATSRPEIRRRLSSSESDDTQQQTPPGRKSAGSASSPNESMAIGERSGSESKTDDKSRRDRGESSYSRT